MVIALTVAAGIALGAHPLVVLGVAIAAWQPVPALVALAGWAVLAKSRERSGGPLDEAHFFEVLSAELQSGRSLRLAVATAAQRDSRLELAAAARLAAAGWPAPTIAAELRAALPVNGPAAAAAFSISSATGAGTRRVFADLARLARQRAELVGEQRSWTAQARLSAWIVGGAPIVLVTASLLMNGAELVRSPMGAAVAAVGLGLEAAGAVVVWWMLRRGAVT